MTTQLAAAASLVLLTTTACAASFHDYVASVASEKMSCPKEQIELTPADPQGYEDAYRAQGCGHNAVFAGRCSLGMCSSQMLGHPPAAQNASDVSPAAEARPSSPSGAASQTVSLSLHNHCRSTVKLFLGKDPQFGSGTSTSMSSNEVRSFSMSQGDMLWLVDDAGKPLSSTSAGGGPFVDMVVLESCTGFGPYR
jgi:hypothetical protein